MWQYGIIMHGIAVRDSSYLAAQRRGSDIHVQVFKGQMGCVQRGRMSRSACTNLTRVNDITRTYVKTWFRLRTLHWRLLPLDQRSARLYSHQRSTDGSTRHSTLPTTIRTALQAINVCYP